MAGRTGLLRMGWRKRTFPAAAGLAMLAVTAVIHFLNPLAMQRFGHQLFDQFQRAAPRPYEDVGVRIVDIDEESIRRLGQWPWPRTQLAQMTERLVDAGAGVVAFDIVFSEPDRTSPENLRATLQLGGASDDVFEALVDYTPHDVVMGRAFSQLPVIMGYFFEQSGGATSVKRAAGPVLLGDSPADSLPNFRSVTKSLDVIEEQALDAGFVSTMKDPDGIIRTAPFLAVLDGEIYPSLALAVLRYVAEATGENAGAYLLKTSTASMQMGASRSEMVSIKFGSIEVPTTRSGALWIHFPVDAGNRVIPAWKVLDPATTDDELRHLLGADTMGASIVFVGTGAQGLRDLVATPVDAQLPGVFIHALATEQVLLGHYLQQPDWAPGMRMLILLAGGIILILIIPITGPLRSGAVGAVLIAGLVSASWFLFRERGLLFDPVYPAIALLGVYGLTSLVSFVVTEAEKGYIKDAFDRYLSPEMVAKIADDPSQLKLGGEERDMTILFSDIRSFSKISEGMTPEQLTNYLNRYLTPMTDILMANKATVDKYIGDAIMSFWNAPLDDPDHHRNAARSALLMIEKLTAMNARIGTADPSDIDTLPVETKIGIGLHSGRTSVGNMGSDQRFAYSVLGDTVNTASRLEGMTKQYGVSILVGEPTAQNLPDFATVELDRAKAVGKDSWLTIHALIGDERVAADPDFIALRDRQAEFLALYRRKDFDGAMILADELSLVGEKFGLRGHYDIMKGRIEAYRVNPPPDDWNGVYVLREK